MKKIGLIVASFALLAFVAHTNIGKPLPNVKLKNLSDKLVSSHVLIKNRPVIISFWSTTCIPCIKELSAINNQYESWKKETGVEVLAISTDDPRFAQRVPLIVSKKNWKFPILKDDEKKLFNKLGVKSNPYTIVVNKAGEIVYEHSSYKEGDELKLIEKVRSLK